MTDLVTLTWFLLGFAAYMIIGFIIMLPTALLLYYMTSWFMDKWDKLIERKP